MALSVSRKHFPESMGCLVTDSLIEWLSDCDARISKALESDKHAVFIYWEAISVFVLLLFPKFWAIRQCTGLRIAKWKSLFAPVAKMQTQG